MKSKNEISKFVICTLKLIQLRWNNLRLTYKNYRLFIRYNVLVKTKRLGVFRLGQHRLDRLELIEDLSDKGHSNKQISQYLNDNGLKPQRVDRYTPKLIWGLRKKFQKRNDRFLEDEVIRIKDSLVVVPYRT